MKGSCRKYTLLRSEESSRVRGWIRGNTKIGKVLDVKVCDHQGRYSVEIMIEPLFRDRTVSWVRIVNGINKYVTETSEEIPVASVENRGTGKLVAKGKPGPKPILTVSCVYSLSWTKMDRRWTRKIQSRLFWRVKIHEHIVTTWCTVQREDDALVRFDDLAEKFKAKFACTSQWPVEAFITLLAKGGGQKRRFQCCLNPNSSEHFLYFRAIQGHSGGTLVDPALQDNVLLPDDFAEYIYHIGNVHDTPSIIQADSFDSRRKKFQKEQAVSVVHSREPDVRESRYLADVQYDLDKPRIVVYKNTWRVHQHRVYFGAIWGSLKEKDCSSIKLDRTQSLFSTHYMRFLLRKWYTWRLERILTAKYIDHQGYGESYSRQICNVEARTSADHQSEQSVKYRETCRGNVDNRIPGTPHSTVHKGFRKPASTEMVTKTLWTDGTMMTKPQIFVRCWVDWGTDHSIRQESHWKTILMWLLGEKKSEREIVKHFFECRRKVFKGHWINAVTLKKRSKNAKDCMTNIQRSLEMETNLSLLGNKSGNGLINNFDYRLDRSSG